MYDEEKKTKIMSGSVAGFHDCVKAFVDNEKKKHWTPRELYSDLTEQETAEKLAAFFNNISNEYVPLDKSKIPVTFDAFFNPLTPCEVAKEIKQGKRP